MFTKILDFMLAGLIRAGGQIYYMCNINDKVAEARLRKADNELRRNESELK